MQVKTNNHKMGPSRLNHGNQQCEYCQATDLEIKFALGPDCPNAPKIELWKLQRPLMSLGSMNNVLIYNEGRKAQGEVMFNDEAIARFFRPNEYKIFVRGWVAANGQVHVDPKDKVPEEEWPAW
ncbi:hypothetical protein [Parvimonas sp. M20]|uniref:hypothetical protein n=2 Tax=unclassified Parvimonas TaxID=1151464 RepID=UPI002B46A899|nr:hypothetical protein [Parvimonas sp. M20]MEB3089982.1 hypothetical protein [Parvimonas sp. M20]